MSIRPAPVSTGLVSAGQTDLSILVHRAAERLAAVGIASPRSDAELLAAHAVGTDRHGLARDLALGRRLTPAQRLRYAQLLDRRSAREPLQHLTGQAAFRRVVLAVGPGVFVPRPETEVVAGAGIEEAVRLVTEGRVPVVVDLGTGSGAIAAAVADEVPGCVVHAIERDPQAYGWAVHNLATTSVQLLQADLSALPDGWAASVDVVVSNPPYVPLGACLRDPEVARYDPPAALWAGRDGLTAIREVARAAARLLRPGGLLVVEHGDQQGAQVTGLLSGTADWAAVRDHPDLTGRSRYVTARRQGAGGSAGELVGRAET